MIIVRNKLTGFLLPGRFPAMCIWPFLLIRPVTNLPEISVILRHERIHARQQLEMVWLFFFLWYITEFLIRFLVLRDRMKAYPRLAHEREAYKHDNDPDYLKKRKPYAWIRYLMKD
jgi:hypothetical protein